MQVTFVLEDQDLPASHHVVPLEIEVLPDHSLPVNTVNHIYPKCTRPQINEDN